MEPVASLLVLAVPVSALAGVFVLGALRRLTGLSSRPPFLVAFFWVGGCVAVGAGTVGAALFHESAPAGTAFTPVMLTLVVRAACREEPEDLPGRVPAKALREAA